MKKTFIKIIFITFLLCFSQILLNSTYAKAATNSNSISFDNYDINNDWVIDIKDLAEIAKQYNLNTISSTWTGSSDINKDNIIDIYDLVLISKSIGKEQGNTYGNINNGGLIAQKGDYRYYSNQNDNGYLYKMNNNCTSITKLSNDTSLFINVIGDWIYYSNYSDNGYLYKIKTDGSNRTKLNTDKTTYSNIPNNYIYYINNNDGDTIYRIRTDGSDRKKITNNAVSYMNVTDDYIFYSNGSDNNKIYKMKIDGSNNIKISDDSIADIDFYNGFIYYCNLSDNYKIYKIAPDGTLRTPLSAENTTYFNIAKGLIYQSRSTYNQSICRIPINNGSYCQYASINNAELINIIGEQLYFIMFNSSPTMYKINTNNEFDAGTLFGNYTVRDIPDTSVSVPINTVYTPPLSVAVTMDATGYTQKKNVIWDPISFDNTQPGIYIFYGTVEGYPKKAKLIVNVYSVTNINDITKTRNRGQSFTYPNEVKATLNDGSEKNVPVTWLNKVDTNTVGNYIIEGKVGGYDKTVKLNLSIVQNENTPCGEIIARIDDWIYFKNIFDFNSLYRIKTDGTCKTLLSDLNRYTPVKINSNYICFSDSKNSAIYRMNLDGTNKVKLSDGITYRSQLVGDMFYFSSANDERLYKVNVLTLEKTKVIDQPITDFCVSGDWVYFGLYKIKTDGSQLQCIYNDYLNLNDPILVVDDFIYYINTDKNLCRVKNDGTQYSIVFNGICRNVKVNNDIIYFNDSIDNNSGIFKMQLDGSQISEITNITGKVINIVDDWIYFTNSAEDDILYKVKIDGSGLQMII